ncbi:phage tail tube protein [Amaricoccus solimangrovi]|uniref:Uncharacterized protein n=1 Tax=Amaricoccus solimangrovi TaxID=2589815 RepID=A0A501WJB0_9RHOB|nr:phage tail tube protein [Amaricoccus solimangrovi]TPE47227.1 hypothetical protein FJM51_20445 [Amaricoccus solimangrovi]
MATARGDQAAFLMREQADFETPAAAADGDFRLLPFYSISMAPTEDVTEDDAIVGDAFPGEAVAGLRNLTGDITVPLGLQSIGWHLRGLFGDPVTTGGAPNYTHVFKMAAIPVPLLFTAGISHRGIDRHFRQAPVAYSGMSLSAQKDGQRSRTAFKMLGSVEDKLADTLDAAPVAFATDTVPVGFQAAIWKDGANVAGVTGFEFEASLGITPDQEELNQLPTAASFLDGNWSLTGKISARFRDTSWYDLGSAGTLSDMELRYELSATLSIVFALHNLRFERVGVPVPNGDILTAEFGFRASRPDSGESPLTVTLKNQTASYGNP